MDRAPKINEPPKTAVPGSNSCTGPTHAGRYRSSDKIETNRRAVKKIFLVGLPNSGKSLIFMNLTGQFTLVANSPLTTLELKRAPLSVKGQAYEVVDTPGLPSLFCDSEEQIIVRDALFKENPDVILQCIDANRLKQSLHLTADLLELDAPLVIAMNAVDETARKGVWIDSEGLSRALGVPVVESIAVQAIGTSALKEAAGKARHSLKKPAYGNILDAGITALAGALPDVVHHKRMAALLLLTKDNHMREMIPGSMGELESARLAGLVSDVQTQFNGSINRGIDYSRDRWIDEIVAPLVKKEKIASAQITETFAHLCRHPLWGIPILFSILYLMFFMVVNVANAISEWMNGALWVPVAEGVSAILPSGFWQDFLIGEYGVLSLGLANALLTVLPILTVFFLLFNTLEDIGYIPNLSVLTQRLLAKLGLSGGSIMPLALGFGCKTMATMTTRMLKSNKEKLIAVYLIAFSIPCAAQMGLIMAILGRMGAEAFFIVFGIRTITAMGAGLILNRLLPGDTQNEGFIQELPAIRLPRLKFVLKKTYYRLYWFLKESLPVFIYAALALFIIDRIGLLDVSKRFLRPTIEGFLGLPLSMVDAIILCFARLEAGAGLVINLVRQGQLDYNQCIVAVVITTTFAPCFANIMAMVKEIGGRTTMVMLLAIAVSAFLIAGGLNWFLVWIF